MKKQLATQYSLTDWRPGKGCHQFSLAMKLSGTRLLISVWNWTSICSVIAE